MLHVDFLSLQLPLSDHSEVYADPFGILVPQLFLCLPAELVQEPIIIRVILRWSSTYLMKSITLKSGTK